MAPNKRPLALEQPENGGGKRQRTRDDRQEDAINDPASAINDDDDDDTHSGEEDKGCCTTLEPLFTLPLSFVFTEVASQQGKKKPLLTKPEAQCFIQLSLLIYELDVLLRTSEMALHNRSMYRSLQQWIVRHRNPYFYPLVPILQVWDACALQGMAHCSQPLHSIQSKLRGCRKVLGQSAEQNWIVSENLQEALDMNQSSPSHTLAESKGKLAELEDELCARLDILLGFDVADGSEYGDKENANSSENEAEHSATPGGGDNPDDAGGDGGNGDGDDAQSANADFCLSILGSSMLPIHDIAVRLGLISGEFNNNNNNDEGDGDAQEHEDNDNRVEKDGRAKGSEDNTAAGDIQTPASDGNIVTNIDKIKEETAVVSEAMPSQADIATPAVPGADGEKAGNASPASAPAEAMDVDSDATRSMGMADTREDKLADSEIPEEKAAPPKAMQAEETSAVPSAEKGDIQERSEDTQEVGQFLTMLGSTSTSNDNTPNGSMDEGENKEEPTTETQPNKAK